VKEGLCGIGGVSVIGKGVRVRGFWEVVLGKNVITKVFDFGLGTKQKL
jgi:hypothetical protein